MEKECIKGIKSRFFALRNGVIADKLRKSGCPYKIIFGLLLPQIEQIAAEVEPSPELAETLWANGSTRESRLLATMVYPRLDFSAEVARRWIAAADTVELLDLLCFRLVRYLPEAEKLAEEYFESEDRLMRYFSLRLSMNLLVIGALADKSRALDMARAEACRNEPLTRQVCSQLVDEISWLQENV